ncbi:MAG: glycerophosphodiester phosphodiesterase [Clostridia bacterium]|nr:glycerophosphodiester phosphodiesterase [Clostridia bacterium]
MIAVYILIAVAVLIPLCWVLMIKPSGRRHPLSPEIKKYRYAHRGLHNKGLSVPENSMSAFRLALEKGYGIELDLHLTDHGSLAVIHDTSLKRTAYTELDVTTLSDKEIKSYPLEATTELIPFFDEVLSLVSGKVPLLIELKTDNDNYRQLADKVMQTLKNYKGIYAIQSFDPRAILHLKKHYPEVMRGQLAGFLRKSGDPLNRFLDFGLRNLLTNFITKPHFVAYRVQDSRRPSMALCRKLYRPLEFNWTCRKKAHGKIAAKNGAIQIFEEKK